MTDPLYLVEFGDTTPKDDQMVQMLLPCLPLHFTKQEGTIVEERVGSWHDLATHA
jgi:hypothetical protein